MLKAVRSIAKNIWWLDALYNATGGLWAILHMRSFEALSGPKTDHWLVRTVGALLLVKSGVLISAGRNDRISPEVMGMAIGSSASLATIDIVYVSRGRLSVFYLLDALAQMALIAGWIVRWRTRAGKIDATSTDRLKEK